MTTDSMHNALGGNSADQLRAYVKRVESLEEEVKDLNSDKSELYKEAKACGFDVPTIKKLVRRRRKDKTEVEEEDAMLELYEQALASAPPEPKDPLDDL